MLSEVLEQIPYSFSNFTKGTTHSTSLVESLKNTSM